ncbi:MAG: class I SAM-dependent methyltransferase [Planctomycetes bacterium]|nr:class I SAM-dependent methyltransferase [Planctomycetota bacterium]
MLAHRIFAPFKKLLPGFLWRPIRRLMTAVLTPFYFTLRTGHFKSALRAKAVDRSGGAIPWYTYSCVDFLRDKDFSGCRVLEFGSGQSTRWWAERCEHILTFEADEAWYRAVSKQMPANVEIHHVAHDLAGVAEIIGDRTFDVVIVDGLDRTAACFLAAPHLAERGALLLDNAEGYGPVMERFRAEGMSRLDFYGHAAGVILPHCTCVFFRDDCFLLAGVGDPVGDPGQA